MLTRLRVQGFKNLIDVDVAFGTFTCIAGRNATGKSNLFDAILFLSYLADRSLMDAVASVRSLSRRTADPASLFHRHGVEADTNMRFEVEMIVPASGTDDLGQQAIARATFLKYVLELCRDRGENNGRNGASGLEVLREELDYIPIGDAKKHLQFPHDLEWSKSILKGGRTVPFISTEGEGEQRTVKLHQEGGGRPRPHLASKLPRTVLSGTSAEHPTALLARREMQSWRLLQPEPSALREPDSFRAPARLGDDGENLAATLESLGERAENSLSGGRSQFFATLANRVAQLIEDVKDVRVDRDETRELLSVVVRDRYGTEYHARDLSDGTLRFLGLAALEADPTFTGLLCLEEPENGIHPDRVPAMLELLRDLAGDVDEPVDEDNPLRQVIVNTHSPVVVSHVYDEDLLIASPSPQRQRSVTVPGVQFEWLPDTWRAIACPDRQSLSRGRLLSYLNPHQEFEEREAPVSARKTVGRPVRVRDRDDLKQLLLRYGA